MLNRSAPTATFFSRSVDAHTRAVAIVLPFVESAALVGDDHFALYDSSVYDLNPHHSMKSVFCQEKIDKISKKIRRKYRRQGPLSSGVQKSLEVQQAQCLPLFS